MTAFQAEGCGIALRAMSFIMPPSAVTSTSSIIIILTLIHPFATSWPSSPKGDARTLRDWLSVSYVTQYPVPPISLFPLEGKCHVVAKGCTRQSTDRMLYCYPDRQSAASLATSWSSPPCKQVALVLISAVVKVFHKRAPSIIYRRPPQPSRQRRVKLKPLKNLRPEGPSTLKPVRACP